MSITLDSRQMPKLSKMRRTVKLSGSRPDEPKQPFVVYLDPAQVFSVHTMAVQMGFPSPDLYLQSTISTMADDIGLVLDGDRPDLRFPEELEDELHDQLLEIGLVDEDPEPEEDAADAET